LRKNKKFKFRNSEEASTDDNWKAEEREYAENWEPNPMLRNIVKYAIMAMILIGCLFVWYNKKFAPANTTYSADEVQKERFLGKKYKEFTALVNEGDAAFESESYFEAAYKYKQALSHYEFYGLELELYDKLLLATEKSCEEGNELHCNNIPGIKKRMEEMAKILKANGK